VISGVDTRGARWTDAGPEVAEAHGALTVVVSHDQIVDYPPSPFPEGEGQVEAGKALSWPILPYADVKPR